MDSAPGLEQVLSVLGTYNVAVWAMQVLAYLVGFLAAHLAIRPVRQPSRIVAAVFSSGYNLREVCWDR